LKRIRVLIDGLPRGLLRDLIRGVAARCSDMELIECQSDPAPLVETVVRERADAVLVPLDDRELPRVCRSLLEIAPHVVVVGIVSNGKRLAITQTLQKNDVGTRELLDTIRAALGAEPYAR
jgi:hypothetical protein